MKSTHRHSARAAGVLALSLATTPLLAQSPQRGGPPGPETPYILIATFQGADNKLAVQASDEVRDRIKDEHAAKELYVVPKNNINSTLAASGYRPDSALSSSDLMELSKQLHGEYVLEGKVSKNASGGVHIEPRILMKTGQQTVAQPLPAVDGKDPGDAAKLVERELSDALKGMKPYQDCTNALRAAKYDEAVKQARMGVAAYSNSSLNRLCLLNAYQLQKAPADSLISAANAVLAIDPTSMLALANLADAYQAKGDTAKAIETNLRIYRADPSNSAIAQSIVQQLANSGAPDKALPIIDSLLKDNPADPAMIRQKWLLQLRAGQYKNAIETGNLLAKLDTSAVNADFYNRQIGAAQADSNAAMVQELASKAAQKFPKDVSYDLLLAQSYNKTGQLQQALAAARRATTIDPKNSNAWVFAIVTANSLKMGDSVSAWAPAAISAGVDKSMLGSALLGPVGDAMKKAQASKARADWLAALAAAQQVDSIAPTENSKYFVGVASFSAAADIMTEVQTLAQSKKASDHTQACTEAKQAEDLLAITAVAMPAGGKVDAATAGQILGFVPKYTDFIGQVKKAFCK